MKQKHKKEMSGLSLIDAVETLSSIAEMKTEKNVGIVEEHELAISNRSYPYKSIRWLHQQEGESTLAVVKDIFRTILDYLKEFYKEGYSKIHDEQTADEIRTMMVLVGEAAKNLDKFAHIFNRFQSSTSVTDLEEFKQLQSFYFTKIAPKIDEGRLGKWVLAVSAEALKQKSAIRLRHIPKHVSTKHVYVDLLTVKRDAEYELFHMRKEDGTRFFNPRLIRNLKLVCDLTEYFNDSKKTDPLHRLDAWINRFIQACAADIVSTLRSRLDQFFHEAMRHKDKPLVEDLTKAAMALLLSASPKHGGNHHTLKTCQDYFEDFQEFLRTILLSKEYQKNLLNPLEGTHQKMASTIRNTVIGMCRSLYLHAKGLKEIRPYVAELLKKAHKEANVSTKNKHENTSFIEGSFEALQALLRKHSQNALNKVLDELLSSEAKGFDPLMQHNIPSPLYALYFGDKRLLYIRMANPTYQEYINKAFVTEEFKGYLLSCRTGHGVKKHVCMLLQDRTTWKEAARCHAVESLLNHKEYASALEICTLSINTDFYHQLSHYKNDQDAKTFKKHFLEHLTDEHSGYYFPVHLRQSLYKAFFPQLLEAIHQVFFGNSLKLDREQRHAFIDCAHLLIGLKVSELSDADALSFCCKDGIDWSIAASGLLFWIFEGIQSRRQKDGLDFLEFLLFAPALLWRERSMQSECFYRFLNVMKALERSPVKQEEFVKTLKAHFSPLFKLPVWEATISWE